MGMKVLDVLRLPKMSQSVLLAGGDGLERIVRSVTVLDAPDAIAWLGGHEFVLTSTYPLLAVQDRLDRFIEQLEAKNVAGLAVKLNRYMNRLPENMIRKADELGLPIVSMDPTLAWIEVIYPIVSQAQAPIPRGSMYPGTETDSKNSYGAGGSQQLTDWLFTQTGKHCVILNAIEGSYSVSSRLSDRQARQILATIADETLAACVIDSTAGIMQRIGPTHVAFVELSIDGRFMGYAALSQETDDWRTQDVEALVELRTAIPATILHRRAAESLRWQIEDDFIRHLIDPQSPSAISGRLNALGRELFDHTTRSFSIGIIEVNARHSFPVHEVNRLLRRRLAGRDFILGIVGMRRLAIVVPDTGEGHYEAEAVARLLRTALRVPGEDRSRYRCSIGISQSFPIAALHRAFRQAELAVDAIVAKGSKDDTRIFEAQLPMDLLPSSHRSEAAKIFVEDWIGPILSEHPERGAMLVETLRCFLQHCGNYRKSAAKLSVHHNTVRYRISMMERLLRRPVMHPDLLFNYMLALELHLSGVLTTAREAS